MSYVIRTERGHGLFATYAIISTTTRTVVTRAATPVAARRLADQLNRSTHTRHRRRHVWRVPRWLRYQFTMSLTKWASVFMVVWLLNNGITEQLG